MHLFALALGLCLSFAQAFADDFSISDPHGLLPQVNLFVASNAALDCPQYALYVANNYRTQCPGGVCSVSTGYTKNMQMKTLNCLGQSVDLNYVLGGLSFQHMNLSSDLFKTGAGIIQLALISYVQQPNVVRDPYDEPANPYKYSGLLQLAKGNYEVQNVSPENLTLIGGRIVSGLRISGMGKIMAVDMDEYVEYPQSPYKFYTVDLPFSILVGSGVAQSQEILEVTLGQKILIQLQNIPQ
jgi:hypothetical protein